MKGRIVGMAQERHINAAYRLLTLLQEATKQAPSVIQLQVWSNTFELQNLSGRPQKQAVMRGIDLMYQQLDYVIEQLRKRNLPENTYSQLQATFERNVQFELINHPWQDFRARIEAEALYPLVIFSNMLPDEEKLVEPTDFLAIHEELEKLEKTLSDKDISSEVRSFVMQQIATIRKAMWEYRFRGTSVFRQALVETAQQFAESQITGEHKNDPHVQKVGYIWQKLTKVMDTTVKTQAALEAGHKIYQLAESVGLVHFLSKAVS
jgi:hypothetical protein